MLSVTFRNFNGVERFALYAFAGAGTFYLCNDSWQTFGHCSFHGIGETPRRCQPRGFGQPLHFRQHLFALRNLLALCGENLVKNVAHDAALLLNRFGEIDKFIQFADCIATEHCCAGDVDALFQAAGDS